MTNTLLTLSAKTPITNKDRSYTMTEAYYKIIRKLGVPSSLKPAPDKNPEKTPKLVLVNQY